MLVVMAMAGALTLYYVRKQVIVSTGETLALASALLTGPLLAFVAWSTWRLHNDFARTVESEQRLVTTLRSIGEVFLVTDESGRVTMMNGVAQQLTGWSESEALGRPLDEVFQIQQPATQEPRESPFAGALRGDAPAAAPDYATLVTRGGVERLTCSSPATSQSASEPWRPCGPPCGGSSSKARPSRHRRATRRCSAAISRQCCERLPKWRPGRWR